MAEVLKRGLECDEFKANIAMANSNLTREKEKRAGNLIIYGLKPESDTKSDESKVKSLINTLKAPINSIKRIARLPSKTTERQSPVLVELNSRSIRDSTLRAARLLKGNAIYVGVQISPDLTPSERLALRLERDACTQLNSDLPENCPFEWRLRDGMRTKIDKASRRRFRETAMATATTTAMALATTTVAAPGPSGSSN